MNKQRPQLICENDYNECYFSTLHDLYICPKCKTIYDPVQSNDGTALLDNEYVTEEDRNAFNICREYNL